MRDTAKACVFIQYLGGAAASTFAFTPFASPAPIGLLCVAIMFAPQVSIAPPVKSTLRFAILALAAALSAPAAHAGPLQAAQSAASAASGVAARTERAVKRGAKAANNAIERGASAAGSAVTKTAKKIGLPTGPAASAPAHTQ